MDIDKNARQTPKGRERASRSAKRWRLPALSSRLLAAYGSRRGRAARTGRFLQRCHSAVGGVRRGELAGGGSSVQGRTASEGPPVAAGLFQVLALKGTAAHVSGETRPLALMTKVIAINCD